MWKPFARLFSPASAAGPSSLIGDSTSGGLAANSIEPVREGRGETLGMKGVAGKERKVDAGEPACVPASDV